jgi:hypothetical protein
VAPKVLAVGASCVFHVFFKPTMAGKRNGFLAIDGKPPARQLTINLTGVGVAP